MPRPQRPWFRLYVEAAHDRKIRRLKPEHRWLWVACLAAARQSTRPGYLLVGQSPMLTADIADFAALSERVVKAGMAALIDAELIELDGNGAWWFPRWNERQFESDEIAKRTAKHRSNVDRRNVPTTFPGTPPETETDTEKKKGLVVLARTPETDMPPDPHQLTPLVGHWHQTWIETHAGAQPPHGWTALVGNALCGLTDPRDDLEKILATAAREGKEPKNLVHVRNDFYAERARKSAVLA